MNIHPLTLLLLTRGGGSSSITKADCRQGRQLQVHGRGKAPSIHRLDDPPSPLPARHRIVLASLSNECHPDHTQADSHRLPAVPEDVLPEALWRGCKTRVTTASFRRADLTTEGVRGTTQL